MKKTNTVINDYVADDDDNSDCAADHVGYDDDDEDDSLLISIAATADGDGDNDGMRFC